MHPILFQRERFLLYLAAWGVIAIILAALAVPISTLTWGESFAITIPMSLLYAFICMTSFYLCRAFPLRSTDYPRLFGIYLLASILSSGLWIMVTRGWGFTLQRILLFPPLTDQNEAIIHLFFLNGILLFILSVFMHYLMIAVDESTARGKLALQQSVLAREAELRALKAQIHPHFLFNSLNSISALTTANPQAAREMSIRLAGFLRRTLRFGATDRVPLADEIALMDDYLEIEKTRVGDRLRFEKRIDERLFRCLIPPLLLQPLIENAVNHGIAQRPEGGTISLQGDLIGERIRIRITNPVDPEYVPSKKSGLGLENVKKRLAAIHGPEGRLQTDLTPGLFVVELSAPAELAGE